MLFFQGAGTWIIIIYGGLNGISGGGPGGGDDGRRHGLAVDSVASNSPSCAPGSRTSYFLNIAYATQLFLEPQVLGLATEGTISPQWTPNQLSYTFAFQIFDVPAAAALSVMLLGSQPGDRRHHYHAYRPVQRPDVTGRSSMSAVLEKAVAPSLAPSSGGAFRPVAGSPARGR